MLDMKFVRENPELVKENIRKKFQDEKLPLVDQVIELDERRRAAMTKADELRANRNKLSKEIGALMAQGKKEEGMALAPKGGGSGQGAGRTDQRGQRTERAGHQDHDDHSQYH